MQSSKRVSFVPTVTVYPITKLSGDEDDKSRLYYSKDEMNSISLEVKAKIRELSGAVAFSSGARTDNQDYILDRTADPTLRGLELHLYPTRVVVKVLAMKSIIEYQSALNADSTKSDHEKMLSLAVSVTKLSQWSNVLAVETARLDSIRSCGEDYLIPISDPVDIAPFLAFKRRRITNNDGLEVRSFRSELTSLSDKKQPLKK